MSTLTNTQRIGFYLLGVALGCLALLFMWPKDGETPSLRRALVETIDEGHYPYTFVDALGREVTIPAKPERIATLAPSLTEMVFELGAGERLVGSTIWCTYPEAANEIPRVGNLDTPDIEILLGMRPDVVLASTLTPRDIVGKIDASGLRVITFRHDRLARIPEEVRQVGMIIGKPTAARAWTELLQMDLAAAKKPAADPAPRALILYGLDSLGSAGPDTWVGDLLAAAGYENIAAGARSDWPRMELEAIAERDPEVIFLAISEEKDPEAAQAKVAALKDHPVWRHITAVKEGRVYLVPGGPFRIPGVRARDALRALVEAE